MYFFESPGLVRRFTPSVIWQIKTRKKKLFLTFDDGPNPESTPGVLSLLNSFNIPATFFCTGKNVLQNRHLYDKILEDGHTTGNHSFDHIDAWKTSRKFYLENVTNAAEVIQSSLFRPPYGRLTPMTYQYLKKKYQIIMWSLLSYDFDPDIDTLKIIKTFQEKTLPGSIWLFHDSNKAKVKLHKTLPFLIECYLQKGFVFESIDFNKLKG